MLRCLAVDLVRPLALDVRPLMSAGWITTNLGPISLVRKMSDHLLAPPPSCRSRTDTITGPSRSSISWPVNRLAWCAIQWRAWLSEARRTGRRLVVSRPCTDPLKRRDRCRKCSEYHSDSEKHEGGAVAIPLVGHEGELHSIVAA